MVVEAGVTTTLPVVVGVTAPTPLSMVTVLAPVTVQLRVALPPLYMVGGETEKLVTPGAFGSTGVKVYVR